MQKSNLWMSKIAGISKSLKFEIVGLDNFLFPKIKKNKKIEKEWNEFEPFSEIYRMKNS